MLKRTKPVKAITNTNLYAEAEAIPCSIPTSKVIPPEKARTTAEKMVRVVIEDILLLFNRESSLSSSLCAWVVIGRIFFTLSDNLSTFSSNSSSTVAVSGAVEGALALW